MVLIELVQERCKILENKTTNSVSMQKKEEYWENLQMNFMSRCNGVVRTVQSLKTCWENIKKRTKKQFAEEKQAIYKTGGGQYKTISDPIAEQVREIIRPAVEGLSNDFDSDFIAGFDSNVDKNKEFDEEWLDEASENVIKITEDNTQDETDGGRQDNDESDKEDDVLNFLQKNRFSWKNCNPQKLQTQISTPLRTSTNTNKSVPSMDYSTSTNQKKSKENVMPSTLKETVKKTSNQLKHENNKKCGTLADSKIELLNLMISNGKEKHEFEIKILETLLHKEKLQLDMQKELEFKKLILEKERLKLRNVL